MAGLPLVTWIVLMGPMGLCLLAALVTYLLDW